MSRSIIRNAIVLGMLLGGSLCEGADPPKPEQLPAPREAAPQVLAPPVEIFSPPVYQRQNRYDVWQYYAVDRHGHWRPRVIYSPSGAYYLYNGAPYPYAITHGRDFMPYATD
jgi:hypothetical protein